MQNARIFFSVACVVLGFAAVAGCENDPPKGNGGNGGEGGEPWGSSSSSASSTSSSTSGGMTGSSSSGASSSSSGAASSSSSSSGGGGDAEPPAMNGMTAAHNAARASVNPPAPTPIPPLTWSGTVAAVAQAHANKCVFQHSNNQYGENIYATSGNGSPPGVVGSWVSEAADYNYASNTCNATCGHYTQVVWANSSLLGCGMTVCNQNSPFGGGSWEFWVCNYDPPGNYIGERPY